jgi:bifunctional oligoribonuclease and PAP phosphatase NrnA
MLNDCDLVQAREAIHLANQILVVAHIRPDGDAVGSALGLGLALENAGKHVQIVFSDGVPESLRFLDEKSKIKKRWEKPIELAITLDCSDMERVGSVMQEYGIPDINIDHHVTNLNFARYNLVDAESAATAEILATILPDLGLSISPDVAGALLAGIIADTIGFQTNSITPETMRIAANLMDIGADLPKLYKGILAQRSLTALRYWGMGLLGLQNEGRLAWTTLSLEDRQKVGYPGRDDADLINVLSAAQNIDIAVIFIEQTGGSVKISWRAQNGYDISQLAMQFGGGGHRSAAGAEIKGVLTEVVDTVLKATRELLVQGIPSQ